MHVQRDTSRVIRSRISVNQWLQRTPTVDEARPAACVVCGVAARPPGGLLALHGHGLRDRQVRGPRSPSEKPYQVGIEARRYDCQRCPAVLIVVPSEVVPHRHYAASAIAFAVALYGACARSQRDVRDAVSADRIVGERAARRWCTLARWIDAVAARTLFPALPLLPPGLPRRAVAERAAMSIGAHAPPPLPAGAPEVRAFFGAAQLP